jgi:hypothetical protein
MRRDSDNKIHAERIHAKRRALERYNLGLNREQLNELTQMIQQGKSRFLEKQSLRVSIHELQAFDRTLYVVYDKNRKTIITFLPLQYIENLETPSK